MCVIYYAQNVKGNNNTEAINGLLTNALASSGANPDGWGYLLPFVKSKVEKKPTQFTKDSKIAIESSFTKTNCAIFHLRNSTSGLNSMENTQPIDLERISVLHNGMFEGSNYPTYNYYKGYVKNGKDQSDTYIFAEKVNELVKNGASVVQAIKSELGILHGWWRVFVYDKQREILYYTANDNAFELSYDPVTSQVVGSTKGIGALTVYKDTIGSFRLETSPLYLFTPQAYYVYKVDGMQWKVCDKVKIAETKMNTTCARATKFFNLPYREPVWRQYQQKTGTKDWTDDVMTKSTSDDGIGYNPKSSLARERHDMSMGMGFAS